jgi:hypothetical protein
MRRATSDPVTPTCRNSGCGSGLGPNRLDLGLAGWQCRFVPGGLLDPRCWLVRWASAGPCMGERRGGEYRPV